MIRLMRYATWRRFLPRWGLGLACAGLLALVWQTAVSAQTPSQLRVAQMMPNADVTVQIQPETGDQPQVLPSLAFQQVSDYQALPPGRYSLTVQIQDKTLLQTTYGLGASDRYTLALYGLPTDQIQTNQRTFMAQLKWIFGGAEAHTTNGYLPQMKLLHDRVSSPSDAPQVRLVHLAPGAVPLQLDVEGQHRSLLSKRLSYPEASPAESVEGEATALAVRLESGQAAIARLPLSLKRRTLTDIFVVGGLTATQPIALLAAEPVAKNPG